ncbi:MAG: hypothetical protein IIY44_08080 [Erysipelotrichales bacterium]|nr:hypothetical protein [Erysipelotrichales bacterium]MBQ1386747.1 hypothetical protein [Erysipelotrichales bacterium]MBQ2309525.1 hypothetical protein [Erysipelotrichales bacterium]MBQ4374192.1 hypothetical protein [Erysipelotrichales bacterium]MBQ5543230.1 hypothetical protein [Erysipelotrichales bacterium]
MRKIRGFTAGETVLVLIILTGMSLMTFAGIPVYQSVKEVPMYTAGELMKIQSDCMRNGESGEIEFEESSINGVGIPGEIRAVDIHVNAKGNIDHPQTIRVYGKNGSDSFAVWLGTGRCAFHED